MAPDDLAADARARLRAHAAEWGVAVGTVSETTSSLIAYGSRGDLAVVLKVVKQQGDEWSSGAVLRSFDGQGVARVYEQTPGALLIERLVPGDSLVDLVVRGEDDSATTVLAGVIAAMTPSSAIDTSPTVGDWGKAFDSYAASSDYRLPRQLVTRAHEAFAELCASETNTRLLHGDLQHSNVLFDRERSWLAIDRKGVVGEIEYELGAALRNPREVPALFTDPAVIERRLRRYASELHIDQDRALRWAFAQAVLSAIWDVEDGVPVGVSNPSILLAERIEALLR